MKTLAILSPNQNAYSETFIQAHRNLPFAVKYYFGGSLPGQLEGKSMAQLPWNLRVRKKMLKGYTDAEKKLIFSLIHEKVDVVLAEYGTTAAESLKAVQYLNLPLVVHFHGYDASVKAVLEYYGEDYQEVFRYAHAVIVVSKAMEKAVLEMGCTAQKLVLNTYGPESSFLNVQPDYPSKRFLSIGRFVEKKAPHLTILAFKKVVDAFPEARLTMIGEGPLLEVCRDLAEHLGLTNAIHFAGICTPAEIRQEMERSMAFVQHSVTAASGDQEGAPVAVLEAQAAAMPVISTLHAGIPDVVIHGETGLLCKEKDVDQMAKDMLRILTEGDLAESLGKSGRERIKKYFTLSQHLEILEQAIHAANGRENGVGG